MGFAAVARVTESSWIACAVHDEIGFGLTAGGELDVHTTLCKEVREARSPIVIDHASQDPLYCTHHTPRTYSIESYVSVPIVLPGGDYFGNLCAIDPRPAEVKNEKTLAIFQHFAHLIALELDNQGRIETVRQELLDEKAGGASREQFIAVLGHDLRNPLSSILACTHLLKARQADPAMVLKFAERIDDNARRMARMIEELLDLARGRLGGGLPVSTAQLIDLPAAVNEVIDELRTAHVSRIVNVTIELDRAVCGDRGRIQQLVSNLVSNALTHGSPSAPVQVVVSTRGGELEISVHNDGTPISAETQSSIFDAFSRHSTDESRPDGLGLGLYICQEIAKAHGGDVSVTSTQEAGTTFTARLPAA